MEIFQNSGLVFILEYNKFLRFTKKIFLDHYLLNYYEEEIGK